MSAIISLISIIGLLVVVQLWVSSIRDELEDAKDENLRYRIAVDDVDRWCGNTSAHARIIAAHIQARAEGHRCNAGTPIGEEPCTPIGLREQLARADAALSQGGGACP